MSAHLQAAVLALIVPSLAFAQCNTVKCVKPVVAVPVVATPVIQQIVLPTYSVSFDPASAAIIAELQAIREELRQARTGQAVAAPTLLSLTQNHCASCHGKGADSKGGYVMVDDKGLVPFSLPERRRMAELIRTGAMPPGKPMLEADKKAFLDLLEQKTEAVKVK